MNSSRPHPSSSRRQALDSRLSTLNQAKRGFTLIELMVVIVIIALLIGLLMPAIFGAITSARDAEVRTEISKFDAAVSSFKAEYGGIEPPSRITLHINLAGWNGDPRSKAIVRRIWPQFNFSGTGGGGWMAAKTLDGSECLVFFLGGVRSGVNGPLTGFSKNPALPFGTGGTRSGPFFEFDISRLSDTDSDSAPEYLDTLPSQTNPYIYYSSYDGKGYRNGASPSELTGGMSNIYLQPGGSVAYKPSSHQIISPGADGDYGTGGIYDADTDTAPSEQDRDNITNFSSGRLVP